MISCVTRFLMQMETERTFLGGDVSSLPRDGRNGIGGLTMAKVIVTCLILLACLYIATMRTCTVFMLGKGISGLWRKARRTKNEWLHKP